MLEWNIVKEVESDGKNDNWINYIFGSIPWADMELMDLVSHSDTI